MKNKLMCISFKTVDGGTCEISISFDKFIGLSYINGIVRIDVLGGISHKFSGSGTSNVYNKLKDFYECVAKGAEIFNDINLGEVVYYRDCGEIQVNARYV